MIAPIATPTEAMGPIELELPQAPAISTPPSTRGLTSAMPVPALAQPTAELRAPLPVAAPPASVRTVPASLDGVMMSGSISSQRRPSPAPMSGMYQPPVQPAANAEATKLLIALAVCGTVPIIVTGRNSPSA